MKTLQTSPRTAAALLLFSAAAILQACAPSPFLLQKYAVYNFSDQGYLTPDLLQTIGRAKAQDHPDGPAAARRLCLETALKQALQNTLSVLMHTHFDIQARTESTTIQRNTFQGDYPFQFTDRDYTRAELDFRPLLKKGFIALQDARTAGNCTIVFRIAEANLPNKVRSMSLTFKPENFDDQDFIRKRSRINTGTTDPGAPVGTTPNNP